MYINTHFSHYLVAVDNGYGRAASKNKPLGYAVLADPSKRDSVIYISKQLFFSQIPLSLSLKTF